MTRQDIAKIFADATDEQISALLDINSTDIGNAKKRLENELDTANNALAERDSTIAELEKAKGDTETLQKIIDEYKAADEERKAAEKAAADEAALAARFDAVATDKKFVNDFTRNGIVAEFKDALAKDENKGKSDTEIFAAMVKDRDGIFVNPNAPQDIPGTGNIPPVGTLDDNQVRAVMGLPPKN